MDCICFRPTQSAAEVLADGLYQLLTHWLWTRPILYPRAIALTFESGFVPEHLRCYETAREVHRMTGWPVIAGIALLDKGGKLFPWPHMVNLQGATLHDFLVDASPPQMERNLGFVPIRLDETEAWNQITFAYDRFSETGDAPRWGDANADALTDEFLSPLTARADVMQWHSESIEIPATMPALD